MTNDKQGDAMLRVSPDTRSRLNRFARLLACLRGDRASQNEAVAYLLDRYEREIELASAAKADGKW